MEQRLIDANELANMLSQVRRKLDLKTYKTATEFFTRDEMLLNLEQIVRTAPTIDPVKHGEWLNFYGDYSDAECNCCGGVFEVTFDEEPNEKLFDLFKISYKYCPNCGARMDGGTP